MTTETMEDALAARLEPELAQFETNAQLWRLDIDRHVHRLQDDRAIGLDVTEKAAAAEVALEGIGFEIARFQSFAAAQARDVEMLVRLAEIAVSLETARRRVQRALAEE